MNNNEFTMVRDIPETPAGVHLGRIYLQVSIGLAVSALVAYLAFHLPGIREVFFRPDHDLTIAGTSVSLLPFLLILVFFVSQSFTPPQFSLGLFYLISACIGLPMAVLPFRFSGSSIVSSALITAATFFALSIFAITTKRNLGWLGNFLFCGLTALLLMSIGNLFFASAHLMTALNIASVILFSGYIAFDTQLAVQNHNDRSNCSDLYDVAEGALNIYFDIVNLFVNLLFLVAGEKN